MKNNITIIGINFFPEDSSTGLYSSEMAEYLSEQGHEIDVITGFPYYPQWEILDSYKNKPKFIDEKHGDIKVHRYKQYVPKEPSFKKRILHLLDFTLGSFRNLFKVKKCDVVIAVVPFTTSIVLGLVLAKIRGAKLWVHIQDFEFDAAKESGLANGKSALGTKIFSFLMKVEAWLLGKADIVSTISNAMVEKLESKTDTESYLFPNWVDPDNINPANTKQHPFLQSKKFKILYSGNIGAKQDWDFFLKIAEHYQKNDKIEFIVVGDGATKQKLVDKTNHLSNVIHYAPVEFKDLPDLLCSADLHILFQQGNVIDTVMPSKMLGMMASEKPSLVTGNLASESAKLLNESEGGYFFGASDFDEVVRQINLLQENDDLAKKAGISARKYIISKFSQAAVLASFEKKIASKLLD